MARSERERELTRERECKKRKRERKSVIERTSYMKRHVSNETFACSHEQLDNSRVVLHAHVGESEK